MSRSKAAAACLSDEWRFTKNSLLFTLKLLKSINHLKYREETFRNTCAIMSQRYEHLWTHLILYTTSFLVYVVFLVMSEHETNTASWEEN